MSAPAQSAAYDDFDFEKGSNNAANTAVSSNNWSPDSGENNKAAQQQQQGLYDNGDTGTQLFPEFKPRGFTKSEPMQRRTLKTVLTYLIRKNIYEIYKNYIILITT